MVEGLFFGIRLLLLGFMQYLLPAKKVTVKILNIGTCMSEQTV